MALNDTWCHYIADHIVNELDYADLQLSILMWFETLLTHVTLGTNEKHMTFVSYFWPKSINMATKVTLVNALLWLPLSNLYRPVFN